MRRVRGPSWSTCTLRSGIREGKSRLANELKKRLAKVAIRSSQDPPSPSSSMGNPYGFDSPRTSLEIPKDVGGWEGGGDDDTVNCSVRFGPPLHLLYCEKMSLVSASA